MKEHIIPYVLKNAEWWSGLNLTNYGFAPTTVLIDYYTDKGSHFKTEEIELGRGCQKAFLIGTSGWARAISDDYVTISQFMGDSKSSMISPIEKRDLVIGNVVPKDKAKVEIKPTQFTEYTGNCAYFCREFLMALEYVARALHYKYPDRQAKQLSIMDGSPLDNTVCTGHPIGTHTYGDQADFGYFTMGPTNRTQYGSPVVDIWTGDKLNSLFDLRRNADFVILMHKVFPGYPPAKLLNVDDRIRTVLGNTAWQMYGDEGRAIIEATLQGDAPQAWNHHLHYHCNYQDVINWGAIL